MLGASLAQQPPFADEFCRTDSAELTQSPKQPQSKEKRKQISPVSQNSKRMSTTAGIVTTTAALESRRPKTKCTAHKRKIVVPGTASTGNQKEM